MNKNASDSSDFGGKSIEDEKQQLLSIEDPHERAIHCRVYLASLERYATSARTQSYPYHCTPKGPFKTIIKTKKIRLSHYDSMRNDETEGRFILNSFEKACCSLEKDGIVTADEKEQLLSIELNSKHYIYREDKTLEYIDCEPYVICFSASAPDDFVLERYTRTSETDIDDGVCFSFPTFQMANPVLGDYSSICSLCYGVFDFYFVRYGDEAAQNIFENSIRFMKDVNLYFEDILEIASNILSTSRLCVKDSKFECEKEVRMVAYIPKDEQYNEKIWDYISIEKIGEKKYAYVDVSEILKSMDVFLSPHCTMECNEVETFLSENGIKAHVHDKNSNKRIHHS